MQANFCHMFVYEIIITVMVGPECLPMNSWLGILRVSWLGGLDVILAVKLKTAREIVGFYYN
jgi:hypothetical protein